VAWLLSRRRRLELIEPILAANFSNPEVLWRRETNLSKVLRAKYVRMALVGPMYFHGKEGAEELYETFTWARELADQVTQRRSSAEWLLLLRRAFLAHLDANAMAPAWFIEAFVRRSQASITYRQLIDRAWRISPRVLEDVHDLILATTAMWNIGRAFRTLSKGLVVSVDNPVTFYPVAHSTDAGIVGALGLFEHRAALWHRSGVGRPLRRAGVFGNAFAQEGDERRRGRAIPTWSEWGSELDRNRYFLRWRTHYKPEFTDPDSVFSQGGAFPPSVRSLSAAAALWVCWHDIGLRHARVRLPNGPWLAWGVHRIGKHRFLEGLTQCEDIARRYDQSWTGSQAMAELERSSTELQWVDDDYALALSFGRDDVLVDLLGATRALEDSYHRPSGGDAANEFTSLFERQVQAVIDSTTWRPEGSMRALIKKKVRIAGREITDIDAVAHKDRTLILIDAKAWATPATLEFGEYFAVEDRRKTAEQACSDWATKVATIDANRSSLGIPPDLIVVGVVVCPEAPFVLGGICTQAIASGLMAISSLSELDWCLRTPAERAASSVFGSLTMADLVSGVREWVRHKKP
jgi:hypothetical protein